MYPSLARRMCYALYERGDSKNRIEIVGTCDDTSIGGANILDGERSLPIVRTNFIPLLSNACISTGNARDVVLDHYDTKGNPSGD
jgi:hypothetical protein